MEIRQTSLIKSILTLTLFVVAFMERVYFDLGPNIELVTLSMVVAGVYLGRKWSLLSVALVMILSDIIIGNTNILIFTWSGFLIPALLTDRFLKSRKTVFKRVLAGTTFGVGSNFFFYLWTNLGVWKLDMWGMYKDNWGGLIDSYIAGLPFLKMQIISTLTFVPLALLFIEIFLRGKQAFAHNPTYQYLYLKAKK